MAPATSAVPLLAAILAAVLVSSAAAAAGPAPNLPHQYSVDRNKTECGGGQGGTCGAYSSRFHFDWDSRASLEVMDLSPTTYKVRVWTPGWVWNWDLTPLSSLLTPPPKLQLGRPLHPVHLVYQWTGDGQDCTTTVASKQNPFHGEWDFVHLNTTKYNGAGKCPPPPPKPTPPPPPSESASDAKDGDCVSWEGPWESEWTADAQVWIKEGEKLPTQLHMICSFLPFELFYTYANWKVGPLPGHLLQPPKFCPPAPGSTP